MDFSQFDSRTAAETGKELRLVHPATGEPLYNDEARKEPCIVMVIGAESRAAQAALRAVQRAKVKDGKKADPEGQSLEDLHGALVDGAKPLITGFKNVMRGDKPATLADLDWFLNLQLINGQEGEKSFVEQVMAFATKRANFLGNASKA